MDMRALSYVLERANRPVVIVLTHDDMQELKAHSDASHHLRATADGLYLEGIAVVEARVHKSYFVVEAPPYGPEIHMLP